MRADNDTKYLTDEQRNEIDSSAKQLLRELNYAITTLQEAEQVRQATESTVAYKKRAKRGLGALGRWAAGGAITAKSLEEELEEAKSNTIKAHRESIIWYLQRALEECGRFQSSMMEIRITREVEKTKSILYKAGSAMPVAGDFGAANGTHSAGTDYRGKTTHIQEADPAAVEAQLDPEQLQLFAQENQDLLKHYEDHLDQVRYVSTPPATAASNHTQDCREVVARDLGAANDAREQPHHPGRAHRPARGGLVPDDGERGEREQAAEKGNREEEHGADGVLVDLCLLRHTGALGSVHLTASRAGFRPCQPM